MTALVALLLGFSSLPWNGPYDQVATVEINTFGTTRIRTAILYRDPDGRIIDWRWYTDPDQIPKPFDKGRYIAVWSDGGIPRTVICGKVVYERSKEDRELAERAEWPVHMRRKLSR